MGKVIPLHHMGSAMADRRAFGKAPPVELRLNKAPVVPHDSCVPGREAAWFVLGCYCGAMASVLLAWLS